MSANLLVQARKLRMSSDLARDVRLCAMARDTSQCEFIREAVRVYISQLTGVTYPEVTR